MKKRYIIPTAILLVMAIFSSCDDAAFLAEKPETFYTVENAFSSTAQVDQVLLSCYSHLRDLHAVPDQTSWIYVLHGNGTDMFDIPSIRKGNSFANYANINPDNGIFKEIYTTFYYVIGRANLAIHAAELPHMTFGAGEKEYVMAQAKFFRAWAYRNLGELFGGVPIVTDIATSPRTDYQRATRIETYQFAIEDLEETYEDLPETTAAGGRLVRGAALHNLSQLYLDLGVQFDTEGKPAEAKTAYAKSIDYANQVIDGGTFSLMNERFGARKNVAEWVIDIFKDGKYSAAGVGKVDTIRATTNYYWDLFQEGSVNYQDGNRECIWALQIDYDAYMFEDKKSRLPHAGSYGPVFRDGSQGAIKETLEDAGGRGVSFCMPTMYTRDEIYADKWGADMRNSEAVFRRRFKGNMSNNEWYLKVISWNFFYSGKDELTKANNSSLCYPVSCKIAVDKFTGVADGQNRTYLFRDDYFIRLPETILLRAEAKQRNGDKTGAAADVNMLRDRAQCAYRVTAADMDDSFNMILDERARELVYEEWRWNTLLRMGGTIAVDRIREYSYWPEAKATLTFDFNLWPIPQEAIDTNKDAVLEQNPGWSNR